MIVCIVVALIPSLFFLSGFVRVFFLYSRKISLCCLADWCCVNCVRRICLLFVAWIGVACCFVLFCLFCLVLWPRQKLFSFMVVLFAQCWLDDVQGVDVALGRFLCYFTSCMR